MLGTAIGALLGWLLLRHPIGLLVGGLIGHIYDRDFLSRPRRPRETDWIDPLFSLAGALSKSDGRVSEREIAAAESLMVRLQLDPTQRRLAIDRFTAGKSPAFDPLASFGQLRTWCGGRRNLSYLVIDLLLDVACADGAPSRSKLGLLRRLCASLGISDREFSLVLATKGVQPKYYGRSQGSQRPQSRPVSPDPYAVLGLERGVDERSIKRAWRKLMSQNHPDKLGDVPAELKRRAEDRARDINGAYERIKAERGFR